MEPRHKRTLLFIMIVLLSAYIVYGQDRVTVQVSQDAKLAFVGDDKGNDALTPNLFVRVGLEGYENHLGYIAPIAEYEYADLKGGLYHRYSLGLAHHFEPVDKLVFGYSAQFGFIVREGTTMSGIFSGDLAYRVLERLYLVGTLQGTIRTDLKNSPFRISGFVGVRVPIN